jgi:hypothetical protein
LSSLGFPLGGPLGGDVPIEVIVPPVIAPTITEVQAFSTSLDRRDLALDANGDLDLSTGDLQFTTGTQAIAQSLDIGLGMVKGEWFLDGDEGFDLYGTVLVSDPNQDLITQEIRRVALGTAGVTGVTSIELSFDRPHRTLTADVTVQTDLGELTQTVRLAA